jgi:Sulfatase-modifying factor enzyme 1
MTSVFLSYRRGDSRHQAGRLYDRLVAQFGKEHVFKDADSIPLGLDFREVLTERVQGPDRGPRRVLRGGDWSRDPRLARSANRRCAPADRPDALGFRLARVRTGR